MNPPADTLSFDWNILAVPAAKEGTVTEGLGTDRRNGRDKLKRIIAGSPTGHLQPTEPERCPAERFITTSHLDSYDRSSKALLMGRR